MKKTSYIIIGIALVIIIVAGYFLYATHSGTTPPSQNIVSTTTTATSTSTSGVQYVNNQYGFTFALPQDWQGYTVLTQTWTGQQINCGTDNCGTQTGTEIIIRNPNWTTSTPYQDIPIMVFTPDQWTMISQENLAVGAAPIPPSELGSNSNYIFALPARYNYAYPQGWQEVQTIMQSNPLQAF